MQPLDVHTTSKSMSFPATGSAALQMSKITTPAAHFRHVFIALTVPTAYARPRYQYRFFGLTQEPGVNLAIEEWVAFSIPGLLSRVPS